MSSKRGLCFRFAMSFQEPEKYYAPDCLYEYFHVLDGYEFLPFKHFEIYVDTISPENDSLIWVCRYCNFWC
jgi:hypothetical protein